MSFFAVDDDHEITNHPVRALRLTLQEERRSTYVRLTIKVKLQTAIDASHSPLEQHELIARFGPNITGPLRELVRDGAIQRRKSFGQGRHLQYIGAGRAWPALDITVQERDAMTAARDAEKRAARRVEGRRVVREARGKAAGEKLNASESAAAELKPWPFYNPKFLPYIKHMDAKMQRRYRRTARIYGHAVPE